MPRCPSLVAALTLLRARVALSEAVLPSIFLILADDLESDYKQDSLSIMPNLKGLAERGVSFGEHIAAQPTCGPSRASILSGRFPHNTGYRLNGDPDSVAAWASQQDANTLGSWFTQMGYYTAYAGKYINGLESAVPLGWRHWMGFAGNGATYSSYNATTFNATFAPDGVTPTSPTYNEVRHDGVHQADFLAGLAADAVVAAKGESRPFFVMVNPTMPHWTACVSGCADGTSSCFAFDDPHFEFSLPVPEGGCNGPATEAIGQGSQYGTDDNAVSCSVPASACPSLATKHLFEGVTNPRCPAWNATPSDGGVVPDWVAAWPPLNAFNVERTDMSFRNRSSSRVDLDRLVGALLAVLDLEVGPGYLASTYVVFTSDNGYHLGEKRLLYDKCQPYDFDIRVPLFIAGPGVAVNATRRLASTHLDLTATLLGIAGITPQGLDGLSFASALAPGYTVAQGVAWRGFAFTENFGSGGVGGSDTWAALRFPTLLPSDEDDGYAGGDGIDGGDNGWGRPYGRPEDVDEGAALPLRLLFGGGAKSHLWCTNQSEVFFLREDPWEGTNEAKASARGRLVAALTRPWLLRLASCAGVACNVPGTLLRPAAWNHSFSDVDKTAAEEVEAAGAVAEVETQLLSGPAPALATLPCYWPVDPSTGLRARAPFDRFDP